MPQVQTELVPLLARHLRPEALWRHALAAAIAPDSADRAVVLALMHNPAPTEGDAALLTYLLTPPPDTARFLDSAGQSRCIYAPFVWSCWLSALADPQALAASPSRLPQVTAARAVCAQRMREAAGPAVQLMWARGLGLAGAILHEPATVELARQQAQALLATQSPAGHLHPLTPETSLDAFVYDELTALHAAFAIARQTADPELRQRLTAMVEWHVSNTQPDNTTHQPWALAAFAALDATGSFAEQQLHDTVTLLSRRPESASGLMLGILADNWQMA